MEGDSQGTFNERTTNRAPCNCITCGREHTCVVGMSICPIVRDGRHHLVTCDSTCAERPTYGMLDDMDCVIRADGDGGMDTKPLHSPTPSTRVQTPSGRVTASEAAPPQGRPGPSADGGAACAPGRVRAEIARAAVAVSGSGREDAEVRNGLGWGTGLGMCVDSCPSECPTARSISDDGQGRSTDGRRAEGTTAGSGDAIVECGVGTWGGRAGYQRAAAAWRGRGSDTSGRGRRAVREAPLRRRPRRRAPQRRRSRGGHGGRRCRGPHRPHRGGALGPRPCRPCRVRAAQCGRMLGARVIWAALRIGARRVRRRKGAPGTKGIVSPTADRWHPAISHHRHADELRAPGECHGVGRGRDEGADERWLRHGGREKPARRRRRGSRKPTIRVGEAQNPGLGSATRASWGAFEAQMPRCGGFEDVVAPGFGQRDDVEGDQVKTEGLDTLRVITANVTAWNSFIPFLRRTNADVVRIQEHKLTRAKADERVAWLRRRGWDALMTPAERGPNGGLSAGAAVLGRAHVGMAMPLAGSEEVVPARAVTARLEPPGCRPFTAIAAYLRDGEGLGRRNLELLRDIGIFLTAQGEKSPSSSAPTSSLRRRSWRRRALLRR